MHRTPERFDELLAQWRVAAPTARPAVVRQLREEFEEELATLVIDMSGFARQVIKEGIAPFLARMNAMRALERLGGDVVKLVGAATDIQLTTCAFGALRGDRSRFASTLHTVSGVVVAAYSLRAPG